METNFNTLDQVLDSSAGDTRALARPLLVFPALGLLLAVIGVYGVLAYLVTMRRHEFGFRMALGARKRDVVVLVLKWGGRLGAIGAGLGLRLGGWSTRLLAGLLEGVNPIDPATYARVAVLRMWVALSACSLPARRAAAADPVAASRCEWATDSAFMADGAGCRDPQRSGRRFAG